MPKFCPKCGYHSEFSKACSNFVRYGSYYRASDARRIQRFRCQKCRACFSNATFQSDYKQKKRHKNEPLRRLLASAVTMRRAAWLLGLTRITVARKMVYLGISSEVSVKNRLYGQKLKAIEFDDLETFEHTKCKPVSVTLAVESGTRMIVGIEVAQMPAKGLLVEKARKYGPRPDHRRRKRRKLLSELVRIVDPEARIRSDQNPYYERDVREYFPSAQYVQYKGKRGATTGQGELKKIRFDPLFSLNHTCAMLRANISRLVRKSWCTTKRIDRLRAHLYIYAEFHNRKLLA